jgi:hypothetical protein
MPRLTLNLPPTNRRFTKAPNLLFDRLLPTLKDTELRLLLVLIRETSGWNREGRTVNLSSQTLKLRTGRESEAIAKALSALVARGLLHRKSERVCRKAK